MVFAIFYFSGTGNTRWAAGCLAGCLRQAGHQATVYSIDRFNEQDSGAWVRAAMTADIVGFAQPIYGADIAPIMKEFLNRLGGAMAPAAARPRPAFVLCTCGFVNAWGPFEARRKLTDAGFTMTAYVSLRLGNNICIPGRRVPLAGPRALAYRKRRADRQLRILAARLAAGRGRIRGVGPYLIAGILIRKKTGPAIRDNHRALDVDMGICTDCGLCIRQCPADAIALRDGRFFFSNTCTACMRCYNFCPAAAIRLGGISADPTVYHRYRGPGG